MNHESIKNNQSHSQGHINRYSMVDRCEKEKGQGKRITDNSICVLFYLNSVLFLLILPGVLGNVGAI